MLLNFANQLPKPVTNKEYTINNYFYLAKEVLEFDTWLFMADFDIKSSFNKNVKPLCKLPSHKSNTV